MWRRSAWRAWRWPLTTIFVIVIALVVFGFARVENIANEARDGTRVNTEQQERLDKLFRDLEAETRARTTESCENAAASRNDLVNAFVSTFDAIDAELMEAGRPPSALLAVLRERIRDDLPPLTCPQGDGPIVIPQPSTTTTVAGVP